MKTLSIKLDDELHALIKKAAHRKEMSLAAYVRYSLQGVSQRILEETK